MAQWHEVYPVEEKMKDLDPEQVFFVDIGGGIGTQSVALREKFPDLKNKIIVEDIPDTIAQNISNPNVEKVPQNFFEPQAITGELSHSIFFTRTIAHLWFPTSRRAHLLHA